MKIILTGSTGFIGREVLTQCLAEPSITSVVALSRRDLGVTHPKLRVLLVQNEDFLTYPDSLFSRDGLQGASACIWSLGKARMPDDETARKVSVDYTLAAAKAFKKSFVENPPALSADSKGGEDRKPFRFVYLSGALAERDQEKPLWLSGNYRRIRGEVENILLSYAEENQGVFDSYIMRPGFVLTNGLNPLNVLRGLAPSIRVDLLAKAMIHSALNGHEEKISDNSAIDQLATK